MPVTRVDLTALVTESRTARRRDVEGLRALAVLLVVSYHVWLGRVSGGVDAFLLVSAFFLTGGLVRRLDAGERVNVPRHWVGIFHRLVPTASVVVAATVLAGLLLLPAIRWRGLLVDAIGSVTYTQNWVLALRAVDGGPAYYGKWANSLPTDPSFFPIAVYQETLTDTAPDAAKYKSIGVNGYVVL